MENLKNNKKLIVVILIIIIIAIAFMAKNTSKSDVGYSVNKNQALKIKDNIDDLSIKVDTIDKPVEFDYILADEPTMYTGIKFSITNNSNADTSLSIYSFYLLDSKDKELAYGTSIDPVVTSSVDESELLPTDIPAGQTVSGYLYFETDSKDIQKLRVAVPTSKKTKNKSVVFGQDVYFEYYYINL